MARHKQILWAALAAMILSTLWQGYSFAAPSSFPINHDILPLDKIERGMEGNARTVFQGNTVESFPVTVLSVLERKKAPHHLILIRASGPRIEKAGGIASGMSGTPVYIRGKLIGAIGYGWNFSDHKLGLVTPISEMFNVWEEHDREWTLPTVTITGDSVSGDSDPSETEAVSKDVSIELEPLTESIVVSGVSRRAARALEEALGVEVVDTGGSGFGEVPYRYDTALQPGAAISSLLAWGDVSIGATGTVTCSSENGRFLAFAHPFLNRGAVSFPAASAWVHHIVPSIKSPFKLGTPQQVIGCVTQDRSQGIGGRFGFFPPAIDVSLSFENMDTGTTSTRRFHLAQAPFMLEQLLPRVVLGLVDREWGRIGEGTAFVTTTIEGGGMPEGWTWENAFFSSEDVVKKAFEETKNIAAVFAVNEFQRIFPLGIHIDVRITRRPQVLFVEGIEVSPDRAPPGTSLDIGVTLRPYREETETHHVTLQVPENAEGVCEVLVRGGGIAEPEQKSLQQGWRAIQSLKQFREELSAREANSQLIVELLCNGKQPEKDGPPGPPEQLLSEIKQKRKEAGMLKEFGTGYYVEGLLRALVHVRGRQ
ncbi:MAG: peptidase S55 [Synergistales bacterium]|nr:peptidase S55 [Synergistales bacterium]